jgi:hypothetical protein
MQSIRVSFLAFMGVGLAVACGGSTTGGGGTDDGGNQSLFGGSGSSGRGGIRGPSGSSGSGSSSGSASSGRGPRHATPRAAQEPKCAASHLRVVVSGVAGAAGKAGREADVTSAQPSAGWGASGLCASSAGAQRRAVRGFGGGGPGALSFARRSAK